MSSLEMQPLAELLRAVDFAAIRHRGQRRKGQAADPYINHPVAVARLLADVGVQELATLQAAVLHDILEDTDTSYSELVEQFGAEVAQLVQEVSDDKTLPKEQRKALQVSHARGKSQRAALIKTADKVCNLQDLLRDPPQGWEHGRIKGYFEWARSVVSALPCASQALRAAFDKTYAVGLQRYA